MWCANIGNLYLGQPTHDQSHFPRSIDTYISCNLPSIALQVRRAIWNGASLAVNAELSRKGSGQALLDNVQLSSTSGKYIKCLK